MEKETEKKVQAALDFINKFFSPWGAAKSEWWEDHRFNNFENPAERALNLVAEILQREEVA